MRRVLVALIVAVSALTIVAAPARAAEPRYSGGADGPSVYAGVAVEGHSGGRSYPACNWTAVWEESLLDRIINRILDAVRAVARAVAVGFGGEVPPGRVAELELDPTEVDTNIFLDGRLADLLGRDSSFVVSYEGRDVTPAHKVVVQLLGTHLVGRFQSNVDSSQDVYHHNSAYPEIRRGTYETGSGEAPLWWDPYYVTADDPGPDGEDQCPPGLIYSPRNSDPRALVPDLQEFMRDLINDVEPDMNPLDRDGGWGYVQVPLNFAVSADSLYQPIATAEVFDAATGTSVWAEAEAVPVSLIFDPGDGSDPVRCLIADAQVAYTPADPGNCSHTYLDSSNTQPGGAYRAVLAVEWKGVYTNSSGVGVGAEFPIEPSYIEFDVAIGEARPAVSLG